MATSESDFLAFATRSTAARVSAAEAQLERTRKDRSPDAVHDLRVALRRLLSVLTCFERTLGRARRLRREARTVLAAGRAIRDRDIALELALKAELAPDAELCRTLERQRALCQKELGRLAAGLEPSDLGGLWNKIKDGLGRGQRTDRPMTRGQQSETAKHPAWSTTESCAHNARRVLPGLAAGYFALGRSLCDGEPSSSDLHDLRLAGKRLRYSLELFRDHCGPALEELLVNLRTVQRQLGAVSDCTATVALLEEEGLTNGSDGRHLVGFLEKRQRAYVTEFLGHWKTQFDAPGEAEAWVSYLGCGEGGSAESGEVNRKRQPA